MLAAPPERFDLAFPGLFAGDPPVEFASLLEEIAADVRPESLARQLSIMAATDQRDLLPRIVVPTLLIWGELDERSPVSIAHELQAAIPDAELVLIPGAGHLSNLEKPEMINEAIRKFCRARSSGAG
jgi:pimeloyl-ACP methyl ester carboxylesterase